ncbi:histone H2A.Z-specific chaperone CHZ1-like [Nicotiana tomentosiformis]|uniref:histone H2A.Z-specific chaperone CHZ1-like n=1 Tax=Nicotiana tomentosiformis TaxID=4098 RepID=UPI00051B8AB7|nr:histone H2A.Z-specific chaperone CHZ1-like [Nicotiana tomentosiformis]
MDPTDVQPCGFNEMPHGKTSDVNARATHSPNNDINKGDNTHGKGKERDADIEEDTEESSEDEGEFYNFHLATDSEGDAEDDEGSTKSEDGDYEAISDDDDDDTNESLYGADKDIIGETNDLEPEVVAARQAKVNENSSTLISSKVSTNEIPSGAIIDPSF